MEQKEIKELARAYVDNLTGRERILASNPFRKFTSEEDQALKIKRNALIELVTIGKTFKVNFLS